MDVPPCRLLVGMHRLPQEELSLLFGNDVEDERIDNKTVARLKREAAQEFREQLTIGLPSAADETGLRRLAKQLRERRLTVKLFLRHPLHAKLYLAHRNDSFNPVIGFVGSSNLTMSGLRGQGELNVDVLELDAGNKKLHEVVRRPLE